MEIFKSKTINLNSGYVNYPTSVKAIWRLAICKAGIAGRMVAGFLQSEQGQPSKYLIENHSLGGDKRTKTPVKTYRLTTNKAVDAMGYNISVLQEDNFNNESKDQIDHPESIEDMSSSQIVLAVIHKQQIEWMKDTKKVK